jgi:uncharacterized protein
MFFILSTAVLIIFYIYWRALRPLRCNSLCKGLLCLFLLAMGLKFPLFLMFFGGLASPDLPDPILLAWGWGHGVVVLYALLLLLRDSFLLLRAGIRTMRSLLQRDKKEKALNPFLEAADYALSLWPSAGFVLACCLSLWGMYEALRVPEVRTVSIEIPSLPPDLEGFRIVQLSDIHVGPLLRADWVQEVVLRVNETRPHLIVLTGDIVDGLPKERAQDIAPLRGLKARYGVWGCPGNHEYYHDFQGWRTTFPDLGIHILYNEHTVLQVGHRQLVLAGVTDPVAERTGLPMPDVAAALRGAPADVPTILLAHRPQIIAQAKAAGVDVQLSGHTHAGQLSPMQALVALMNDGFVQGLYTLGTTQLYVSSGTGLWTGFPLRVGTKSAIIELELHAHDV